MQKVDIEVNHGIRRNISVESIVILVSIMVLPVLVFTLDFLTRLQFIMGRHETISIELYQMSDGNVDLRRSELYWFGINVYGELDSIIQIVVLSIFATTALSTLLAYHKLMMSKGSPTLHLHLDLTYLLIFVCLIALALSFLLFHYIDTLNAVISDLNSLYSRYNTYISDHNLSKSPLTKFSTTYLGISLPATFAFVDIFLYSAIGIVLLLTILIYLKVGGR